MMRLVDLAVIDSENHVYRLPGGHLEHVFDGDIALEPICYEVDDIDKRLKLKHPPDMRKLLIQHSRSKRMRLLQKLLLQ